MNQPTMTRIATPGKSLESLFVRKSSWPSFDDVLPKSNQENEEISDFPADVSPINTGKEELMDSFANFTLKNTEMKDLLSFGCTMKNEVESFTIHHAL